MIDFKKELIAKIERAIPELKNKVQAGAVDASTPAPYAAFSTPEEIPIRTIHGIAGYSTSFDISVYHPKFSEVETLKHKIINALERETVADKRCYLKSSESGYYSDCDIHGYTITFKIV